MSSPMNTQAHGYFPPLPQGNRGRSSSSADPYRSRAHSGASPYQPEPQLLGPHQQPFPPAGTLVYGESPYPHQQAMGSPHINMPVAPRRPSATEIQFRRDSTNLYQEALRRPSYNGSSHGRRGSHDSRHSHHSHHSHLSRSEEQRQRDYVGGDVALRDDNDDDDDDDDDDEDESQHHHHHHHEHHHRTHSSASDLAAYRQRLKDRGENVSRSWGDSLMSVFYPLKYLFEPRDKY